MSFHTQIIKYYKVVTVFTQIHFPLGLNKNTHSCFSNTCKTGKNKLTIKRKISKNNIRRKIQEK